MELPRRVPISLLFAGIPGTNRIIELIGQRAPTNPQSIRYDASSKQS
jgi:hypothetical protein